MNQVSHVRLLLSLLGSSVLISILVTGVAFVIYGSWETEAQAVMINTRNAAIVAISAFTVFNLTFGLATVVLLLWMAMRGLLAFALAGAMAGLVFGLVSALAFGTPINPIVLLVLTAVGAVILILNRALCGVRLVVADQ